MRAGVGYCNTPDAFTAGKTAAREAVRAGQIQVPDLVLAFCSGPLQHGEFLRGIREAVGERPVIGGSTVGIITNQALSYTGHPAGVAALQLDRARCRVAAAGQLDTDEKGAGRRLVTDLSSDPDDALLLMFYDSIKHAASSDSPPVMNASPPLIDGVQSLLPSSVPIIAAGLIGDYEFQRTQQLCGDAVHQQSVVGALLSGPLRVYSSIMHGCSPVDGRYHRITRMQGAVIQELDGRPIVEIIDELYGDRHWRKQHPLNLLTLGVNHGQRYRYREEEYVNRLITGILPDGSGVGIFEPDLESGMEVQFMLRDGSMMIESARKNAEATLLRVVDEGREPVLGLYIDCAGRAAALSNTETEEAAEVQRVMNRYGAPLLGFYSGVEVAPILGKSRGLDWTGVLAVIAKDRRDG